MIVNDTVEAIDNVIGKCYECVALLVVSGIYLIGMLATMMMMMMNLERKGTKLDRAGSCDCAGSSKFKMRR